MEPAGIAGGIARRILSGGAWVAGGKGIAVVSTLIAQALLARLLPPEDVGAYFLMFSMVSIAAMLSHVGLNVAVVRFTAGALARGESGTAARVIRLSLSWGMAGAAFVAFFLLASSWVVPSTFDPRLVAAMAAGSLWMFCFAAQTLVAEAFRGLHDIRAATLVSGVASGVLIIFGFLWLAFSSTAASLQRVVVVSAVAVAIIAVVGAGVLVRRLRVLGGGGTLKLPTLMRTSLPLWASSLMLLLIGQADLWITGVFTSGESVAVYGAAWRIVSIISMPLLIVNGVLPPLIADLYARGEKARLERVLQRTAIIAGVPATVLLTFLAFYGSDVLRIVYGDYYASGAGIVAILSIGQIVNVLAGSCGLVLMMTGHHDTMMLVSVLSAVFMVVLSIALVGRWGATGVAVGAAGGLALQNVLMWIGARRMTGLKTHASLAALEGFNLRSGFEK